MSKIYSKKGDAGKTSLGGGTVFSKDDPLIECIGAVDELISNLGLLRAYTEKNDRDKLIEWMQNKLQAIIGDIVQIHAERVKDGSNDGLMEAISEDDIKKLERTIDRIEQNLDPLSTFVIPGKNKASAQAHVARTVCRRAERRIVSLNREKPLPPAILQFINRLSDTLFMIARSMAE